MKLNLIETKEILDFEKEIGFELVVNERAINLKEKSNIPRYFAQFERCEVMVRDLLSGAYGNGDTIDEAISNYCIEVSNCKVAFNAYGNDRKEIQFPKLIHTKLIQGKK